MTTEQTAHCGNCGSTAGKLSGHVYFHCGMCFHVTDPLAEDRGAVAKDLRALIARMRNPGARHRKSYRGSDVVDANIVDDWADELAALL